MKPLVSLAGVGLRYPASRIQPGSIKELLLAPFRRPRQVAPVQALEGIDLALLPGDRLGVIGHNGAGKSTLLRVMAGVYPIDQGTLTVAGRIHALFDLSLGFEYEATGRQNIHYRGLLLGHTPAEIAAREAEIVDFAGLGEFIDYPVKAYSAGMLVRLAFATSTAMEGDILLLDEVIGAGDAAFAARAAERITGLIARSRAMVLVSHDLQSIRSLCTRCVVLDHGRMRWNGDVDGALACYVRLAKAA
jgi:lipopolysaccharide transport system ATP-binding protein